MRPCATAAQNILLAIDALGAEGGWTAAYPYQERVNVVKEVLGIPDPYIPFYVISLGYPAGVTTPKDKWKPEKVHYNGWSII